jgi:hypothetical protein
MRNLLYTEDMDIDIKFCQSAFMHGINEADIRWAIDTVNPPKPGPNGTGLFAQRKAAAQSAHSITVDAFTADYLLTRAIAAHKTPAEIIGEMVQEQIAAASTV